MIEVKGISKKLDGQKVLDRVSIFCTKGSINGIIGRNGSGKSILLKCICGFFKQDEGEIYNSWNIIMVLFLGIQGSSDAHGKGEDEKRKVS